MTDLKTKCPKCGESSEHMLEITQTWGSSWDKVNIPVQPTRIEVYCNTCGQVSIINVEIENHTVSAKPAPSS